MTSGSKEGPSRLLNMALDQVNSNSREINKKSRYHDRRKPYNNDRRRVNYRDRSRDRSSRDRYNSSSHRDRYSRKYILKVSNLDHTITREHLKELFSEVGKVEKTWIDYDRTARSKVIFD
uniref:RRM domain-containing protein n=1 Tax=Babesia bovis TaxID=5865 RepID=A7APZ7_BABBO|eukprot:XP_001612199.1 hypothetical protein [Babesia bovis T2Bo]